MNNGSAADDLDDLAGTIAPMLRRYLRYVEPDDAVGPDDDLVQFGLDSLGAVDLLLEVENAFGIEVPDELLGEGALSTLGSLTNTVRMLTIQRRLEALSDADAVGPSSNQ